MEKYLSPNVSPRMRGVVEKCSFCFHRYQLAKNKAYLNGRRETWRKAYQTACTQACPAGAIVFGDLNNPDHKVHQIVQPDPKTEQGQKSQGLSAAGATGHQHQGLLPVQKNGSGEMPETTTSPMKNRQVSRPHH
jgi:Fe-S-cluster-containing dehydrogenase component